MKKRSINAFLVGSILSIALLSLLVGNQLYGTVGLTLLGQWVVEHAQAVAIPPTIPTTPTTPVTPATPKPDQAVLNDVNPLALPSTIPNTNWDTFLSNTFDVILTILGLVAFVSVVYSGVMYITSGGDAAKAVAARRSLLWSIIGLLVISLSFFIVSSLYRSVPGINIFPSLAK